MKKIIYAILLLTTPLSFGCKTNESNVSIRVKDTETAFTYDAVYPLSKTEKLEDYVAQQLNNELPMDQNVDTSINWVNGEKFGLKTSKGVLSIQFDKRNSSVTGYVKIKKFTDGISEILSDK